MQQWHLRIKILVMHALGMMGLWCAFKQHPYYRHVNFTVPNCILPTLLASIGTSSCFNSCAASVLNCESVRILSHDECHSQACWEINFKKTEAEGNKLAGSYLGF